MRTLPYLPILGFALFRAPWRIALADARRWSEIQNLPFSGTGSILREFRKREFRSLFYHRFKHAGVLSKLCVAFASFFFRPEPTLHLWTREIGEGFFIQHGVAAMVGAKRVGRNCWVTQQVSIGYLDGTEGPTLEDGVRVYAGAKVLGPITIGENTRIGANAVVVKSAPPNCTLVGVPARIVRRDGRRVDEPL